MQQKLLVRVSLLFIGVALLFLAVSGTIVSRAPAKSADQRFAELYAKVQIGMDPWRPSQRSGIPESRSVSEGDYETIVSMLRARSEDEALRADPNAPDESSWLSDRDIWLKIMTSKSVEWRKWEHPTDPRKWFAVGIMYMGTSWYSIVCKVRVGF
jgi:hypothetical protein